jgi:hypothetical protein
MGQKMTVQNGIMAPRTAGRAGRAGRALLQVRRQRVFLRGDTRQNRSIVTRVHAPRQAGSASSKPHEQRAQFARRGHASTSLSRREQFARLDKSEQV